MSTITTKYGSGGAKMTPGGAGTPTLATVLREVADDFDAIKDAAAAAAATLDGAVDGLLAQAPTTPSSQITGGGNTTWNINVTAGYVFVEDVGKYHAAQVDYSVHAGSKLLDNGQSVYAWLVEKNVTGTVTMDVVKGTPATTGNQVAPTDGEITTALSTSDWIKLALLLLNRTGDTTVTQSQDLSYRQPYGTAASAIAAITFKTLKG